MPTEVSYYKSRWRQAKVKLDLSFGLFDGDALIGFIIHGIDQRNSKWVAFNTGTGILPSYRGHRYVQKMYEFAIPKLRDAGIEACQLEVITKNAVAIKAYESIGFVKNREMACFNGRIASEFTGKFTYEEKAISKESWVRNSFSYSWDNQIQSLIGSSDLSYFQVNEGTEPVAYFITNKESGYISQWEIFDHSDRGFDLLFSAIKLICPIIKINNVDLSNSRKIEAIRRHGLIHTVSQYEMRMKI